MAQYINKDALIAEIEKRINFNKKLKLYSRLDECNGILYFLDKLKVKEVDLDAELNKWRHNHFHGRRDKDANGEYLERISQLELAKYFFELGLVQKGE